MITFQSEDVVISAMFTHPQWFARHREQITAGLFGGLLHQRVVNAVFSLACEGDAPDIFAVCGKLRDGTDEGRILAADALGLASPVLTPSPQEAARHLSALRALYERRSLAEAHQKAATVLLDAPLFPASDAPDVRQQVEEILAEAGKLPGKLLRSRHVKDIIPQVYDEISARREHPGKLAGISTGITSLDRKMGGMMSGHVIVFAGLPGDGKSTLMQNCAESAAFAGHRVRWYPLEMPDSEQVFRLLASAGEVDNERLFSGLLSLGELEALKRAQARLKESPIEIVDVDGASAGDIIYDIERSDCEIAVVDYLQLMEEEGGKNTNREQIISSISRRMKRMAKRSGKTILTGSQLNDYGKLRESRAIGQDADKVLIINKHPAAEGQEGEHDDSKRLLFCAKNRGGKPGWDLPLRFLGHIFQFKDII